MATHRDQTPSSWKPSFSRLKKRIFSHSSVTDTDSSTNSALALPIELIILILSHLKRPVDLARVCRTCRTLRRIAEPMLYNKVLLSVPGNLKGGMRLHEQTILYRTVATQRIREHVTVFRVYLPRWTTCPKFDVHSHTPDILRRCTCDKLDRLVGAALENLPNLKDLRFHCYLCRDSTDRRHHYLSHLATRKLQEFSFMCTCSTGGNSQDLAYQILSSPMTNSIERIGLEWSLGPRRAPLKPALAALFDNPGFLEKVHTIQNDGSVLMDTILSKRSIKRLVYQRGLSPIPPNEQGFRLQDRLAPYAGRLTHLLAKDLMKSLSLALADNAQPYRSLRCIGSLHFLYTSPDDILLAMKPFSVLPNLQLIDVHCDSWDPDSRSPKGSSWVWDEKLLERLELQHPSLQRVYLVARNLMITIREAILWERRDKWQTRMVQRLKYWDIVNGEIDKL